MPNKKEVRKTRKLAYIHTVRYEIGYYTVVSIRELLNLINKKLPGRYKLTPGEFSNLRRGVTEFRVFNSYNIVGKETEYIFVPVNKEYKSYREGYYEDN